MEPSKLKLSDPTVDPWEAPQPPFQDVHSARTVEPWVSEIVGGGWAVILMIRFAGETNDVVAIAPDRIDDLCAAIQNCKERAIGCAAYYGHKVATEVTTDGT